jgi:predicted AAA+ superfamily ATPase
MISVKLISVALAKETGVTVPTVQRYIRYLEASYQALALPAWFPNPVKKLVKAPKIHFMDQGILRKTGSPAGNEFESAIVVEIYKQIKSYNLPFACCHFCTLDGREVDLLLESEDYFIAIEIKSAGRVNRQIFGISRACRLFCPNP